MVFHLLANKMDNYSGDLFIDFTNALEHFTNPNEEYPIVFMGKTHADLIDRYENILVEENKPHGLEDCVKLCKETLGLDFMVEVTPYKVIITNYKASVRSINDLVTRLHDFSWYKNEDSVEVVDNREKKED